jgi:hypothetical protein
MKKGMLALTLAAGIVTAATAVVLPTSARAQAAPCVPGFTLLTGGVPEADLNGDGLTCEVNSIDVVSAVWTTIAYDNAAAPTPPACPDAFTGVPGMLCCKTVPPQNMKKALGRLICIPGPMTP